MKMLSSRLVTALIALVAVSAGAQEVEVKSSAFGPGEQITYRIEYLGMSAGSAQVTVGARMRQWDQDVWPVVTIARTESVASLYPIKDKFITYWNDSRQATIGSDLYADEGRKKRRQRIQLAHDAKTATVIKQREGQAETSETHEIAGQTQDVAAATMFLRNQPLAVGASFDVPIFTGAKSFTMKAAIESKQKIATPLGEREVFKVRVTTAFTGKLAAKRDLLVYFTTDENHLPVRMEADLMVGALVAEVTQYRPGMRLTSVGTSAGSK
jgi:hypothetical protein